jgi:tetratricopeptide (TPR) repeat protein
LVERGAQALTKLDVNRPPLFATLVRTALADDDTDQALVWLDRAIALENDSPTDRNRRTFDIWRAEIHSRSGSPEAAAQIYQEVLDRFPTDAQLALDAAATLLDGGHFEQTLALAKRARSLALSNGDAATLARADSLLADAQ